MNTAELPADAVDYLQKALDLIKDPKHWTIHVNARDENGRECASISGSAKCFCINGALMRVHAPGELILYLNELAWEHYSQTFVTVLNDTTDHATVCKFMEMAIKKLKEIKQ
jgi:hypothetical protein